MCDTLWFEGNLKNLIDDSVEFVRTFLQMFSLLPCGLKHTQFFFFQGHVKLTNFLCMILNDCFFGQLDDHGHIKAANATEFARTEFSITSQATLDDITAHCPTATESKIFISTVIITSIFYC